MQSLVVENRHTGERLALRRVMRDGQLCLELKGTLPPRQEGPPLHIHHVEIEEGRVIAGTLDSGPPGRPPIFYMAHLAWRHRRTQTVLFAPRWLQAVLVPGIVLLGMVLGRYRGSRWPGCPDRCIEAPFEPA